MADDKRLVEASPTSMVATIVAKARKSVIHIGAFSVCYNLLLFSSPLYMIQIYNRVLPARSDETLVWLTVLIVALFVSMSAIDMARHLVLVRMSNVFDDHVTKQTMHLSLVGKEPTTSRPGVNIIRDIDQIRSLLTKGHLVSLLDILWFPIFVITVGLLHPALAILALIGGAWLAALALLSHFTVTPAMECARTHSASSLSLADQLMAKIDVVHALGMRSALVDRWSQSRSRAVAHHVSASQKLAVITAVSRSSRMLAQSITLGVGAYLAIQGSISAGAIIAASVLVGRALAPIDSSISAWQDLLKARSAYNRLTQFLETNTQDQPAPVGHVCQGWLSVEHLSYSVKNHLILRDISFDVKPGEMLAIVGPSGSGKTTLARHLIGGWQASHGSVRLDEMEISKLTDDMRNRYLGYVPQEIQLLDGTIIESISRFGKPVPEEIIATAQLADIHEMVLRLPDNYGTLLGPNGPMLSAGQRQRLALARALYGNPIFVVLDEPCAHLDEMNERALAQTLEKLKERGVTVCVVTHKSNLVRIADLVLVLSPQGQARVGTPEDLLRPTLRPVTSNGSRVA